VDDPDGIQVMTIHKAKGKQFDGASVLRRRRRDGNQIMSNFIWRDDAPPYREAERS
jgi:DNA helicase-2/ATP-dependent DNA helicase PcrA